MERQVMDMNVLIIAIAFCAGWLIALRKNFTSGWDHFLGGYFASTACVYGLLLHWNGIPFGWHGDVAEFSAVLATPMYVPFVLFSAVFVRKMRK